MLLKNRIKFQNHPYHLVEPSYWPINTSIALGIMAMTGPLNMQNVSNSGIIFISGSVLLISSMYNWFNDVVIESSFLGCHTLAVQRGILLGVTLFIISEALFFLAIFWAFYHSSLSPNLELGTMWPPLGIVSIDAFELPFYNTIALLSSGVAVTMAHHAILSGIRKHFLKGLVLTIILAIIFTLFQLSEYLMSSFTLTDGVYGSAFYFGTGFHGVHVIIGTIFILVGLIRGLNYQLLDSKALGLESGIAYWHFVDIVWILLYLSMYYWGA